jgi:hypothetical protein
MTTAEQLTTWRTVDLIAGLESNKFGDDLMLRGAAEVLVKAPERRQDLILLLTTPLTPPRICLRIARYLKEAALDFGDVKVLVNMIVRQSMESDTELVRHLVACVGPLARKHFSRSKCVAVIERLLDAPALDRHARAEVLKALAEVAEVHDVERLLARTYRSADEHALVGVVVQGVLRRPLLIRRLSPAAFEDLVCRVLEARERHLGRSTRFRVCGRPYDGGVDGRGGNLYATGADDPGETTVLVQCKNTDRFSMRDLEAFDAQTTQARNDEKFVPQLRAPQDPWRIFVTAARSKHAELSIQQLRARDIELMTGSRLVGMVKEFLGREASLSRG